jgi:hypothetical protein
VILEASLRAWASPARERGGPVRCTQPGAVKVRARRELGAAAADTGGLGAWPVSTILAW